MLPPVLEDYRRQIESVKAGGLALAAQMTPQQMLERPAVGAWSAVEILDHMRLTV